MQKQALAAVVSLSLLFPLQLFAQTSNATLGGTVSDASGAFIPGVTVTAVNTATGITNTVISNEAGGYQNLNVVKRVRLAETKELEFRADAVNALNHRNFGFPNLNINSTGNGTTGSIAGNNVPFGRITTATGDRKITVGGRLNF